MLGVGANISEEVWKQIVNEIDENGDGEVSFEEFKMMMVQLLKDNWVMPSDSVFQNFDR